MEDIGLKISPKGIFIFLSLLWRSRMILRRCRKNGFWNIPLN